MPSSSSPVQQRRRQLRGRKPLDRSGSSFLGSLKSIVTAPLSWFSNTDEFDESQDVQGKRRRVATAPTELMIDSDGGPPRNKRMRVDSPTRPSYHVNSAVSGYNDPPASAFQSQLQPSNPLAPRSASVSFPVTASKSYGSLGQSKRVAGPPRNNSIDPPARIPSSSFGLNRDGSMNVSAFDRITVRDTSLPPVPGRSFVMRTSMTPQPQPRELSEPPSLSALAHNPTFVRAPSQQRIGAPRGISRQPSITLGTLAESVRSSSQAPVRQHSSLFPTETGRASEPPRTGTTIEKALHDLDIYKTPLVPTRLRSSRSTAAMGTSNMFKSRRRSLILMQDERSPRSKGRKDQEEEVVTNDTKPYAGRGGMKKLLARRKQEAEDQAADEADRSMEQDEEPVVQKPELPSSTHRVPSPPPVEPSSFQPKPVAPSSIAGSSLRVGRSKQRNHIARPAVRPSKMKFSAVYEDDDDNMEDDETEAARRKDREELEAASKKAPVFNMEGFSGFSFAKSDAPPIKQDMTTAKEPPLPSLPFLLFNAPVPSTSTASLTESKAKVETAPAPAPATAPSTSTSSFSFAAPTQTAAPTAPAPAPGSGGVPNFFSGSSMFSKPLDVPKPPPLMFGTPSAPQQIPALPAELAMPKSQSEQPKSESEAKAPSSFFSQPSSTAPSPLTPSLFGSTPAAVTAPAAKDASADTAAPQTKSLFSQPSSGFSFSSQGTSSQAAPTTAPSFSFGAPTASSEPKAPSLFGDAPKPSGLFGSQPPAVTVTPAAAPESITPSTSQSTTSGPAFSFGQEKAPAEAPKPSGFGGFSFGQPSSSAPKPLFGGDDNKPKPASEGGFSFGAPKAEEPKAAGNPFNFGAAPSTPVAEKKPAFSFSTSTTTTPTGPPPIAFSFSAGSTGSTDGIKPFSFGQPAAPAPIERPITPPRNQDLEVNMDESPVREVQPENKAFGGPSLNGGGFSFGSQPNGASNGFGFGSTPASNPFAKSDKPPGSTLFGTGNPGFGQPSGTSSTGFPFGQSGANDSANSRPSTGAGFSFGSSAPAEPPKVSAPFTFGGPGNTSSGGGFGQAVGSAPNSPSTFSQSSPFAFGASLPPVQTSFSFGSSQPASPATSTSGLPPPAFGGGGGFGQSQPSPAAASPGGTLFTIGSSAAPAPGASGARQIKKLPNRRGGKR